MKFLSSTELRANLSAVMDQVNDDHEPVIVTRARGKPVVMVSLEDWASMDETTLSPVEPCQSQGPHGIDCGAQRWEGRGPRPDRRVKVVFSDRASATFTGRRRTGRCFARSTP